MAPIQRTYSFGKGSKSASTRTADGQLLRRVKDLVKNLSGSRHELDVLQEMAQIVSEKKQIRTQDSIDTSMKTLIALQDASARASASLEIVNTVLAGSLAFDVLDRITGEWTVVNTNWMRAFVEPMMRNTPVVWLIIYHFTPECKIIKFY